MNARPFKKPDHNKKGAQSAFFTLAKLSLVDELVALSISLRSLQQYLLL